MSEEAVRISYDPATGHTTLDDHCTAADGTPHWSLGVYPEPYGLAGAESAAMLHAAAGRIVQLDLSGAGGGQSSVDRAGHGA